MNTAKARVATITGNPGNINLIDAAITPISAPMFIVLAKRRRLTMGRRIFLEYLFLMTASQTSTCDKSYPCTHLLHDDHHGILKQHHP